VEDRNTGILSVVPDAPEEPEPAAAPTDIPSDPARKPKAPANPVKIEKLLRGAGLALAFAGIAFLVADYMGAKNALKPLPAQESSALSSFVRSASVTRDEPPVLFAHVDESWELLSAERRRAEAELLFQAASKRWGTWDGFVHRGNALVAQRWDGQITVFGSLHGDEE
jgi:hypothetical protein